MNNAVEAGIVMLDKIESSLVALDLDSLLVVDRNNEESLQITFKDNVYLLNVHRTLGELWLSSPKTGAHHFSYKEGFWQTSKGLSLKRVINDELGLLFDSNVLA